MIKKVKPRIGLMSIDIADLERSLAFYRDGLGLKTDGLIGTVNSRKEVDETLVQATKARTGIIKPADNTCWDGNAGYYQDPNDHLWEVAWNPSWEINE